MQMANDKYGRKTIREEFDKQFTGNPEDEGVEFESFVRQKLAEDAIKLPQEEGKTTQADKIPAEVKKEEPAAVSAQKKPFEFGENAEPTSKVAEPTTNINEKTSLKNRYSEAERKALNLSPLETRVRAKAPELFDNSKNNYDPAKTRELAEAIIADPNIPVTRQQQMDLLYDKVNLRNQNKSLSADYEDAVKSEDFESVQEAQDKLLKNNYDIDKNTQATKQLGTTISDIFRDRKLLADLETGTLENDLAVAKAKNNNQPLTDEKIKVFTEKHKELEAANNDLQKLLDEEKTKSAKLESDLAKKKMQRDIALNVRKAGRARTKEELISEREKLQKAIYVKLGSQLNAMIPVDAIPDIARLAKNYLESGINTVEGIVDQVYNDLKDKIEGLDKTDIMDAISGYGKVIKPSEDQIRKQWTDVKAQIKEIRKLQDLEEGERPKKGIVNKTQPSKELQDLRQKVKDQMKEQGFTQEDSNANYLRRLHKQEVELKTKIDNKDFEKTETPKRVYPKEVQELQMKIAGLKNQILAEQKKIELANRSKFDKTLKVITDFARNMKLTGLASIAKLTSLSLETLAIKPALETVGGLASKVPGISKIAEQAPVEGGFSGIKTELNSLKTFVKTINSDTFKQIMKNGETNFSALYGDEQIHLNLDPELLNFFGRLHAVLKEPLKEATFDRAYTKYRAWQEKNGIEMGDGIEDRKAQTYAYNEAMRTILLRNNGVTKLYGDLLSLLERKGKVGKSFAAAGRLVLPIVRVPTNFAMEATEYTFGLPKAIGATVIKALQGSLDNLSPTEADYIMRNLKKGTVGAGLVYIGYKNPELFGGYYEKGEKKQPGDVAWGGMKIAGVNIPTYLVHNPILETFQFGATLRQVMDKMKEKNPDENDLSLIRSGVQKAFAGSIENVPFTREPIELVQAIADPDKMDRFLGSLISGAIVPPDLGKIARAQDVDEDGNPIKRQTGVLNTPMSNIPYIFKYVPEQESIGNFRP
jgi:hypothetical protein